MQTLEQFLNGSRVSMRCSKVELNGQNTFLITESWAIQQYASKLVGSNGDRPVKTIIGSDDGPPDLPEVLDALAAQAAVVDQAGNYEEWAVQMGFDPDSRRGERVYRTTRRQARLLFQLLGDEAYKQLLWHTERL